MGILNELSDLGVYKPGCFFTIEIALLYLSTEEWILFILSDSHRSDFFAHTPLTDHLFGQSGSTFYIHSSTGREFVEDQFFGRSTTEKLNQFLLQICFRIIRFLGLQEMGCSTGKATGYNSYFMNRFGLVEEYGAENMSDLMIGCNLLLFFADCLTLTLFTHRNFIFSFFEVIHLDAHLLFSSCQQSCLIDQIGQVSTTETGCTTGYDREVDVF